MDSKKVKGLVWVFSPTALREFDKALKASFEKQAVKDNLKDKEDDNNSI